MAGRGIPVKVISKLKKDNTLADIIANTELPENGSTGNVYHDLIRSITSQQLSTKVARVIFGRLMSLYDGLIPETHQLIDTEHEVLRSIGYSNQKAAYIRNVASYFSEVSPEHEYWKRKDNDEIIKSLTSIKGVGRWTAQMVLMFTFERPDVFPVDDLGIQMGMKHFYNIKAEKKELITAMEAIAQHWRPYRTYACRYIWAAKDKV